MIMLYSNPELVEKLSAAGLERAEKYFDRPIMLNNILEDFNKTTDRG